MLRHPFQHYLMAVFILLTLLISACSMLATVEVGDGQIDLLRIDAPAALAIGPSQNNPLVVNLAMRGTFPPNDEVVVELSFGIAAERIQCRGGSCLKSVPANSFQAARFDLVLPQVGYAEDILPYTVTLYARSDSTQRITYQGVLTIAQPQLEVYLGQTQLPSASNLTIPSGINTFTIRNPTTEVVRPFNITLQTAGRTAFTTSDYPERTDLAATQSRTFSINCQDPAIVSHTLKIETRQLTSRRYSYWYLQFNCALPNPASVIVQRGNELIFSGGTVQIRHPSLTTFTINLLDESTVTLANLALLPDGGQVLEASGLEEATLTPSNPQVNFTVNCRVPEGLKYGLPITRQVYFTYNNLPYQFTVRCSTSGQPFSGSALPPLGDPILDAPTGDGDVTRPPLPDPNNPNVPSAGFIISLLNCSFNGGAGTVEFNVLTNLPNGTGVSAVVGGVAAGGLLLSPSGEVNGDAALPAGTYLITINAAGFGSDSISANCF